MTPQEQIEALTAQLESTLRDRKLILEERDRTFALMLARAEKTEADNARLREALAADPWFLGRREWAMHIRFALKGETP